MRIASNALLMPLIEKADEYAAMDKAKTAIAIAATMSRFGPSGSSIKASIVLEHAKDVAARISAGIFGFDMSESYHQIRNSGF